MSLKERLEKFKKLEGQNNIPDFIKYKEAWVSSVNDLQHTIMYRWFQDYEQEGLMEFSIIPIKRDDPYIGEYLTTSLEITLVHNKYLVLEPITGITGEYDGKLEFYMRGNIYKKVSILRKIGLEPFQWIIAKSVDPKDHYKLDKVEFEKLIEEWLQ